LNHPRLRRTSAITHYAAAAALEAVAGLPADSARVRRLGIINCLHSGCVQYSHRFFDEVLKDPATASPLVFPETVFAAPVSHITTLLPNPVLVSTLTGDPSSFLQGVALAAQWLGAKHVDACLVIGAEESNWLLADALWHFEHQTVISGGAGALCLSLDPALSAGVELGVITEAHTYATRRNRCQAAKAMRAQLPTGIATDLLCDGLGDSARTNAAEQAAWQDWAGARLSPKRILGEGLMAAAAWQCVAACDAVANGSFAAANVSLVGCNQQAVGARFIRSELAGASLSSDMQKGNIAA
jgi:3-oxoacyl-(acyl-carrier-protein) synthase